MVKRQKKDLTLKSKDSFGSRSKKKFVQVAPKSKKSGSPHLKIKKLDSPEIRSNKFKYDKIKELLRKVVPAFYERKRILGSFSQKNSKLSSLRGLHRGSFFKEERFCFFVKVVSNNIFLVLVSRLDSRILKQASSGSFKFKASKKSLKFFLRPMLDRFMKDIGNILRNTLHFSVVIQAPKHLKKIIFYTLSGYLKSKTSMFHIDSSKPFNGCRAPKKIRKKRRKLRIFK